MTSREPDPEVAVLTAQVRSLVGKAHRLSVELDGVVNELHAFATGRWERRQADGTFYFGEDRRRGE